ncbi:MAG: response regulator, partial [Candidatus Binataceae bacterium]
MDTAGFSTVRRNGNHSHIECQSCGVETEYMTAAKPVVLVVEDDVALRYAMERTLQLAGFDVHAVAGYYRALHILGGTTPVDALVADLNLGDSIDGDQIAQEALRRHPNLKILFVSGNQSWRPTFGTFLQKPVEPDDLVRTVRRLLDLPRSGSASGYARSNS